MYHKLCRNNFIMEYLVAYNNEYFTSLVPRPNTPQFGKLIAFEMEFLENKEY